MADVSLDTAQVYWYDKSRWWLYVLYIPNTIAVDVGDYVTLTDSGTLVLEGEVIKVSDDGNSKIVWLKSYDYMWLEENTGIVSAMVGEYEINESISNVVDEADLSLATADLVMFDVGNDVEVWIGNSLVLKGYAVDIEEKRNARKMKVYGYGRKLINTYVNMIYYNSDVFDIVKDMVERTTDLTVEGSTTGMVLEKFVAKDYLVSLIEDLAHIAGYQIRVVDKTLYFEPLGNELAGYVLSSNVCSFSNWQVDMKQVVNELYLAGSELTFHQTDKFTGDGTTTTFDLTYRPIGNIKVTVDGTVLIGGVDYTIDNDKPSITFKTAPASSTAPNVIVEYDYGIGILVRVRNDDSIKKYGVHDKKLKFDWVKDFDTAKNVAWGVIRMFAEPYMSVKAVIGIPKYLQSDLGIGKKVHCVDSVNKEDVWMVIKSVIYRNGRVELELGSTLVTFDKWVTEVDDRLRALEKEKLGRDTVTQYYLFNEDVQIKVQQTLYRIKTKKINSGLIFGRGLIGVDAMSVSYGPWIVVYEVTST